METGRGDISLKVKKLEDLLYKSVIPLSCNRLLHPDVEEYIVHEAEKSRRNSAFHIAIQIAEETPSNTPQITSIIHKHFESKHEQENHQMNKILTLGLTSLCVGFAFLVVMFLITKTFMALLPENALMITLRELFIILGWVALWRPAELLLYEWRPHKRNAKLFDKLAKCDVQVIR
jgi:hypothetical protein